MTRRPLGAALAAALVSASLAGCASDGSGTLSTAVIIADVEQATEVGCALEPDAADIAQLVDVGDPALATASAIAAILCRAAGAPLSAGHHRRLARIPAPVVIDGITIHFH